MKVAFGVSLLARGLGSNSVDGIGSVTRELLAVLPTRGNIDLLPVEFQREASGQVPGALPIGSFKPQALATLLAGRSFPWSHRALAGRVDLFHATDHRIPRLRGIPVLATLMDAIPLAHPEWVGYRWRTVLNLLWRHSARWADHVVTISEFSRQEIVTHFRLPEERVSVMPLGVNERWFARANAALQAEVRATHALPDRFFLFVGTLQPRKNVALLLAAHARLPAEVRRSMPLVLAGRAGWRSDDWLADVQRASQEGSVRWLQYVPHDDLPVVMQLASALLFPSLSEGFGLPVLEAFARETLVVASNTTALPEVAGDAAILLDPAAPDAWRETMLQIAESPAFGRELRARGLERAQQFRWEAAADRLLELYRRLAGT